jgi:Zn-dependent protease
MPITFVFIFTAWIFSLCVHEFAHAAVAYRGGDYTVKDKGYLALNPLKFTDPFLSIILPMIFLAIGGIGLPGGCVYIERSLLRSRGWDCLVSLAGPFANVVLAIVFAAPFYLGFVEPGTNEPVWNAMAFLIGVQCVAVVLNMMPVPGLDGFGALAAFMDELLRAKIYQHANMFFFLFIILIWNVRELSVFIWGSALFGAGLLGVETDMFFAGRDAFMFWRQ